MAGAPVRLAITVGVCYAEETHPAGDWVHPDGYIVVEGQTWEQARALARAVLGETSTGFAAFAFDYPLEEFEARPTQSRYYPRGRLAVFSALPHS